MNSTYLGYISDGLELDRGVWIRIFYPKRTKLRVTVGSQYKITGFRSLKCLSVSWETTGRQLPQPMEWSRRSNLFRVFATLEIVKRYEVPAYVFFFCESLRRVNWFSVVIFKGKFLSGNYRRKTDEFWEFAEKHSWTFKDRKMFEDFAQGFLGSQV